MVNSVSAAGGNNFANENEKVKAFEEWANGTDENSVFQYADSNGNMNDIAQSALKFSEAYVNEYGNNDGNISFEEFWRNNPALTEEADAKAIYNLIDINGKDGITGDEYASYLMTIDNADGQFDGNMNLDNFNSIGAEIPVFAQDQYAADFGKLHEASKQHLGVVKDFMNILQNKFYQQ